MSNKIKICIFFIFLIIIILIGIFFLVMQISIDTSKESTNSITDITDDKQTPNTTEDDGVLYLHKSSLEKPEQNKCNLAREKALEGLEETNKKYIKREFRLSS